MEAHEAPGKDGGGATGNATFEETEKIQLNGLPSLFGGSESGGAPSARDGRQR